MTLSLADFPFMLPVLIIFWYGLYTVIQCWDPSIILQFCGTAYLFWLIVMPCFVCFINIVWYAYDGCHLFMLSSYYHFVYCSVVVSCRLAAFLPLSCRYFILLSCHHVVSFLWSAFNLSSCRPVVESPCHLLFMVSLSSCHPVIKSPCHHLFTQSSTTMSSSIYDLLTKLVIMSLPPLVTIHISYYFVILLSCYCTVRYRLAI